MSMPLTANGVALIYVSGVARPPIVDVTSTPLPPVLTLPFEISLLDPTAEQLTSLLRDQFFGIEHSKAKPGRASC